MRKYNLLVVIGCFAFQMTEACKFPIPNDINRTCGTNVTEVLEKVSSCKKAEKILEIFANSTSLSSALCPTVVDVLEAALVSSKLEKTAKIIDCIGAGAWIYLLIRAVTKRCIPAIQRSDVLRSRFQRFLSSDLAAFIMTIPCLVSFLALVSEWEGIPLIISACASGIPAIFGSSQCIFDLFWKVPKFALKRCCGLCLPTPEELEEENRKLIVYKEEEIKKLEGEIEQLRIKVRRNELGEEELTEGENSKNEKSND